MDLKQINKSALLVSPICMGTATIGSIVNERDSFKRFDMFYENGGNFLDTSNIYSDWIDGIPKSVSEKTIGKWIKSRNLENDVIVATKGGHGILHGVIAGKTRLGRDELNEQIQKSLENLCVNSIGSSIVIICVDFSRLILLINAASVVDLPEPVGPVTSTNPRG